jgi:hypothetical protein
MKLTPEQNAAVAGWIAAGDSLSTVQQKLRETFELSLTYMDVRFLVDDLDLTLVDAKPKADTSDLSKTTPPPAAKPAGAAADELDDDLDEDPAADDGAPADDNADLPPAVPGNVQLDVDHVTLIPGALASGTVTFSDGVFGKWIVDNYGRPGFTEISQPGYRPSPEDSEAFMTQLDQALRKKGL